MYGTKNIQISKSVFLLRHNITNYKVKVKILKVLLVSENFVGKFPIANFYLYS